MYFDTQLLLSHLRTNYKAYLITSGAWVIVVLVKLLFQATSRESAFPFLLFSWVIMVGAWYGGRLGGLWATFLSAVSLWYLFLSSPNSWVLQSWGVPISIFFFLAEASVITLITDNLRSSRKTLAQTLKNLKKSTEKFNLFSNNAKGFALIFLSPEGEIRDWNPGAQRLLGYRENQVLDQSFTSFYLPSSKPSDKVWASKKEQIMFQGWLIEERWLLIPNQKRIWCHITYINLEDEQGRTKGIGVICRDRTDQKELELQKDAFLDGASHELKTPLTTIKLLSQMSLKRATPKSDLYPSLQKIDLEVNRMVELVNILLDVTKIQQKKLKLQFGFLTISTLIKALENRFTSDKINIISLPGVEEHQIVADEKRLLSACFQLLHYLLAGIAGEKPITVSLEIELESRTLLMKVVVKGIQRDAWVEMRALLGEVKRQYYTSEKGDKGVGLYFATHIFQLHDIRLMSRWSEDQGLTIKVVFPITTT